MIKISKKKERSRSNLLVTANNFSSKYGINWESTLLVRSLSPPQASARLKFKIYKLKYWKITKLNVKKLLNWKMQHPRNRKLSSLGPWHWYCHWHYTQSPVDSVTCLWSHFRRRISQGQRQTCEREITQKKC